MNQFVARVEPDEQDDQIHRSLADRYVSVRPELDGVSFQSAALSSRDAAPIHRMLTAIAAVADPSDTRTLQHRRADALVDVLIGRISNGCTIRWDGDQTHSGDEEDSGATDDETNDEADANGIDDAPVGDDDPSDTDGIDDAPRAEQPRAEQPAAETIPAPPRADSAADLNAGGDTFSPADSADSDAIDDWDLPPSTFRPDRPTPVAPSSANRRWPSRRNRIRHADRRAPLHLRRPRRLGPRGRCTDPNPCQRQQRNSGAR